MMKEKQQFIVEVASASPSWRIIHILLSSVAAVGSMGALISFALVLQKFKGSCPLYSDVPVTNGSEYGTFAFDQHITSGKRWSDDDICNYCLFTSVSSFIYSFIWLWFFSVCTGEKTKNFSSLSRPWLVVPPAVVFNFVMTILVFVASGILTSGVNEFCSFLDTTIVKGCSRAQNVMWDKREMSHFYTLLIVCQASIWIASFAWLFGFLVLLLRCCAGSDFQVLKIPANLNETSTEVFSSPGPSTA